MHIREMLVICILIAGSPTIICSQVDSSQHDTDEGWRSSSQKIMGSDSSDTPHSLKNQLDSIGLENRKYESDSSKVQSEYDRVEIGRLLQLVFNHLPGLIIGILSSLIAWYILFHGFSSKLKFSEKISHISSVDEPGGCAYRVKFENAGRRRIINLSIVAKLKICGLNSLLPLNVETTLLPLSFDGQYPIVEPSKKTGSRHLVRIRVNKNVEFEKRDIYPSAIRDKAAKNNLTLHDLLSIGSKSTVQLIAFGFDSFSGSNKTFYSKEYVASDIVNRLFQTDSVEIIN